MVPRPPSDRPAAHDAVKRELLVRLLDAWLPAALHGPRRATYLDAAATGDSVAAALGVVAEFPDLLSRRRLSVVLVAADGDDLSLTAEVTRLRRRTGPPAGVSVQIVPWPRRQQPGSAVPRLETPPGSPLFGYLDAGRAAAAPDPTDLGHLLTGTRAQALVVLDATILTGTDHIQRYRAALGPAAVACVELVDADGRVEVLVYRTPTPRGLETFKDALWALDEYAGVRFRDPHDPEHALLDISLHPHPGPLRRALLGHLSVAGARTVAELRRYALAETIYRSSDVVGVLSAMVQAGIVRREPDKGRLTADALISLP